MESAWACSQTLLKLLLGIGKAISQSYPTAVLNNFLLFSQTRGEGCVDEAAFNVNFRIIQFFYAPDPPE
jgi:hypothetical protein